MPRVLQPGIARRCRGAALGELSLIQPQVASRGSFVFRRGPKRTLSPSLFAYALIDFWNRKTDKHRFSPSRKLHTIMAPRGAFLSSMKFRWGVLRNIEDIYQWSVALERQLGNSPGTQD